MIAANNYNLILLMKTSNIQHYYSSVKFKYLCKEIEDVLLSFQIADSNKFDPICFSKNQQDYIIYRYGTKDKIELEHPLKTESSWKDFTYSYYIEYSSEGKKLLIGIIIK